MIDQKELVSAKKMNQRKWLWHGVPTFDDVIVGGAKNSEQGELAPGWLAAVAGLLFHLRYERCLFRSYEYSKDYQISLKFFAA